MLAMIDHLRCQVIKLKEAGREAGHGDLVDRLMEESDIAETMRSPEMSCFARLYQDAVRRRTVAGSNPRKDFVRDPYRAKQRAVQMTQHFPGVLEEDDSPGGQQLRALDYPHAGGHAERRAALPVAHATLPATLQSLKFGTTGAGRGGSLDYHARVDMEASPTAGSRHDCGIRMISTAGPLMKSSPGLGLDWDMGPGAALRGSAVAAEGTPRHRRATSPRPLGPGFGGPASWRKAQAAHGVLRMDAPHGLLAPGGGDAMKLSRSEPQLRAKTPSSLPQLAAGKGGSEKASKEPVAWNSQPVAAGRAQSKRALRAPSPAVRHYQDPEPFLMISA